MQEIFKDAENRMKKTLEVLHEDCNKIRTGRPHPSLLDAVRVDYYGVPTPLSQVSTVSVQEGAKLLISPWEKNLLPAIEKAITQSDLGLNPSSEGGVVHIVLPALTAERRLEYVRQVKQMTEQAKVSLRNIRRDVIQELKNLVKNDHLSEDEEKRGEKQAQELIDRYVVQIDATAVNKEKELKEI